MTTQALMESDSFDALLEHVLSSVVPRLEAAIPKVEQYKQGSADSGPGHGDSDNIPARFAAVVEDLEECANDMSYMRDVYHSAIDTAHDIGRKANRDKEEYEHAMRGIEEKETRLDRLLAILEKTKFDDTTKKRAFEFQETTIEVLRVDKDLVVERIKNLEKENGELRARLRKANGRIDELEEDSIRQSRANMTRKD
ncbi:uncharacterized protein AB675_4423 [Cyphellophora attinorum]|uniref:Uncharacterized protein n=1 Tax=Cyphellophora attinorum TaxID=1664694 RepID=A0A0N0NJ42_9EURO|nr:uncharacterized protein AB675_4423 [Phialophora attinorum]KPI36551.1 hypothetical protein AB675_4423 [Phialophora attinorum]